MFYLFYTSLVDTDILAPPPPPQKKQPKNHPVSLK